VLIFQEQILRVAREIAGLSWEQAGYLRRGMSKMNPEEMARMEAEFIQGCQRPLTEARQIVEAGRRFERADVVFVTDGLCRVTPEFLAEFEAFKKRTGTRVFAVMVDVGSSAGASMRQWADQGQAGRLKNDKTGPANLKCWPFSCYFRFERVAVNARSWRCAFVRR
jgi:hypothetical protein